MKERIDQMRKEGEERSEEEEERKEKAITQQTLLPVREDQATTAITGLTRDEEINIQIEQREDRERGYDKRNHETFGQEKIEIGHMTGRLRRMRR